MTATPTTTTRITQEQVTWFAHTFDQLVGNFEKAVLG
jgi:MoxR-like ATPase